MKRKPTVVSTSTALSPSAVYKYGIAMQARPQAKNMWLNWLTTHISENLYISRRKRMRINQRGEATYSSFQELALAYNIKPVSKVTKDSDKLASQKKKFANSHKCRACGEPLTYIGGNVMACTNKSCKGIKHTKNNDDGTKSVYYTTSYDILDELGSEIAGNIFNTDC